MLITDVIMADLNGIDAAIQIRALLPKIKILLFSGQAATADLLEKARAKATSLKFWPSQCIPRTCSADCGDKSRGTTFDHGFISCRPSRARAIVTSSAYSISLPAGTPVAMRVIRTEPVAVYLRASWPLLRPSSVGLVARITSSTSPRSTRATKRPAAELVRPHAVQGRECPVQHVVHAVEACVRSTASMFVGSSTTQTSR